MVLFLFSAEGGGSGLFLELGDPVIYAAHVDAGGVVGMVEVDDAARRVHHGVLLVMLNQLSQTVEHFAPVHVELFVHIPGDICMNIRYTFVQLY